jgi:C2H2-type zinc finger
MSAPHPDMLPFYYHSAPSAGAGGGGEDPHRNPFRLKSAHEADVPGDQNPYQEEPEADQSAQGKKTKRHYPADPGPFGPCPVCQRSFKSSKALHGHMRCHPDRAWRGMVPPEQCDSRVRGANIAGASAAEGSGGQGIDWPFRCRDCGANFRTKQALGGHRASHKTKKGCYMMAREGLARLFHGASINNRNNNNNNNNINNNNINNNNAVMGINNRGGAGNRRDGLGQGLRIVDLNLPPPQEEEEGDEEEDAQKD